MSERRQRRDVSRRPCASSPGGSAGRHPQTSRPAAPWEPTTEGRPYAAFSTEQEAVYERLSDEELTGLALGGLPLEGDLEEPIPLSLGPRETLLPGWYMPPTVRLLKRRWVKPVVLVLVVAFVVIEAAGLCSTYGSLVVP